MFKLFRGYRKVQDFLIKKACCTNIVKELNYDFGENDKGANRADL